ncbi:4Fe-4S dicluster domain-containing protein [Azotobacter armeniacus]
MALKIVESCVNCWACVDVCPSEAISLTGRHFKISASKCTECDGDYEEKQCASICPVEGAILLADGTPANPPGSLTGIPPERLVEAMREIQAR